MKTIREILDGRLACSSLEQELIAECDDRDKRIRELEKQLERDVAKCPNADCDGKGTICLGEYPHEYGEVEYHLEQCQWCAERKQALEEVSDGSTKVR